MVELEITEVFSSNLRAESAKFIKGCADSIVVNLAADRACNFDSTRTMQDFIEMTGDIETITDTGDRPLGSSTESGLLAIDAARIGTFRKQRELAFQQSEKRMAMASDAVRMGTCEMQLYSDCFVARRVKPGSRK